MPRAKAQEFAAGGAQDGGTLGELFDEDVTGSNRARASAA